MWELLNECIRLASPTPGIGTVDGRTRSAKVFELLVSDLVDDLGGPGAISRAELEIARRAAGLGVLAMQNEASIVSGIDIDVTVYATTANAQRRLLADLGLERRSRDVTPTLASYMATEK